MAAEQPGRSAPPTPVHAEDEALESLDPAYKSALRVSALLFWIPALIGALIGEAALSAKEVPVPFGLLASIVLVLGLVVVVRLPARRYRSRGYHMSRDALRVVRGIWWHSDTIVPFGRVQHIDVDQGPIERFFDIATLTLHTAGTHNASVQLPGLKHKTATAMREAIRARIKRDSL
ncbi:MAG: PH domain-containing protein [Erythrobacter sp.]|nr:PH domain-containing protein [Erythrobacter sp.]